jgi:hypothetical protein
MLDSDFAAWEEACEVLDSARKIELKRREELLKHYLTDMDIRGVKNLTMPNGKVFSVVYNYSYKVTGGIYKCLDLIDQIKSKFPGDTESLGELIKLGPSFSKRAYNELSPGAKEMAKEIVNITSGLPRLLPARDGK